MEAQLSFNNPYMKKDGAGGYVNMYGNPIARNTRANEYIANAQIYAATKMFTGVDVDDAHTMASNGFPVNVFRDYSTAYNAMLQQEREKLAEKLYKNPENHDQLVQETQRKIAEGNNSLADAVLGKYYDIIQQDPNLQDQDEYTKKSAAAKLYMTTEMARIADQAGISDWAGALLVPDMSLQVADYLSTYHGTGSIDSYINSADYLYDVGKAYNSLDPEQKVEFVQGLVDVLPGITSNQLKQVEIFMGATGQYSKGELRFNQYADKLDALTLGLTAGMKAGTAVAKASRSANVVKTLTKAGNVDIAGVAVDQVLREPNAARKIGITAEDAAYAADPRQTSELNSILNGSPSGVATAVRDKLAAIDRLTEEAFNTVDQGLGLDEAEMLAAQEKRIKYLEAHKDLDNVRVVSSDEQGYRIAFDTLDTDGNIVESTSSYKYTVDDVTGQFIDKEASFLSNMPVMKNIIGTGAKVGNDKNRLLYAYEQIDFASRKMGKTLKDSMNLATQGLNKKSIEKLNHVLIKGDDASKVYSYDDLVHVGVGGIRLTEKEYESYVASRRVMDNLWLAKNAQVRRDLSTMGVKDANIGGTFFKAKPYDTVDSARVAYRELDGSSVVIPDPLLKEHMAGAVARISDEDLATYYSQGYSLVRASKGADNMFPSEAMGKSTWALVKNTDVSELGPYVLNYRQGYIPRAYDKAHYFVKKNTYGMVDGVSGVQTGVKTERYFDNIDDAEKYIDQLERAAKETGGQFDRKDYAVLGDREMTSADLDSEVTAMWGGLYSGHRTEDGIKFGLSGDEAKRISAIESMQNYMEHIATRFPMSQYRMGIEKRWMNHAKDVIPEMRDFNGGFKDARSVIENSSLGNSAAKKKLLDAHDQIDFMNRTPTVGEEQTAGMMRKVIESMSRLNVGGKQPLKPLAKHLGGLNKVDPVAAARTGAFHMYLGFFNPAQFFVQGMGASIAMSMSPVHAAKGLTKFPGFVILDNILDPAAKRIQARKLSKLFGDDFEDAYEAWRMSGLYESAVITNSDAYSLYKGLPITQGRIGKILENGTFFFKQGELVNLRMSFLTAYEKFKSVNKGRKIDNSAMKSILAETEKYRLHMTNANKGDFQKGILSVPTQFMQISVRYMEALFGKELSGAEKLGLVLGQASLFGAAGVPLGKAVLEKMVGMLGVDPNEMSPEDQIKVQRGMIGWLLNDYMDIDAAFTSRVAIGEGVTDMLTQFIAGEEVTLPELLLGPFGGVVDQSLKALSDAMFVKNGVISADELTTEDIVLLGSTIAQSVASLPSSTRNLMKAMFVTQSGAFRDGQGNLIMANPDPKVRDIVAQALGFSSQDVSDFWRVVIDNKTIETAKAESVELIMRNYVQMFNAARADDAKQQRAFELMLRTTYSMFPNPKDRQEVLSAVLGRMQNGSARIDVEMRKHMEWLGSELGDSANSWVPLINKYREERTERAKQL